MPKEYIERWHAVDAVLDVYCDTPDIDLSCEKFEAVILKIPAADVAEVVHAKWDDNGRCTNCGGHAPYYCMASTYYASPYCFECGAKMDKEETNERI